MQLTEYVEKFVTKYGVFIGERKDILPLVKPFIRANQQNEKFWGFIVTDCTIKIYYSWADYIRSVKFPQNTHATAYYLPQKNRIGIISPTIRKQVHSWNELFLHEVNHVYCKHTTTGYVPAWMYEGIAICFEKSYETLDKKRWKQWFFAQKRKGKSLYFNCNKWRHKNASYYYSASYLVVDFLLRTGGRNKLCSLLKKLPAYGSHDRVKTIISKHYSTTWEELIENAFC